MIICVADTTSALFPAVVRTSSSGLHCMGEIRLNLPF